MWSICKKELAQFFGNISGYIAVTLFFIILGFYLFVLSDSSILDTGFASLDNFFAVAPWVFIFLLPALCMRMFPEEYSGGTFELLRTSPVSSWQIALGKYWSVVIIVIIILLPTLLYIFTINNLSTNGNIDIGGIAGSYIGLFFLAIVFAAISLCAGSFTGNSVVAFLLSAFCCLLLYFGFNALSRLPFFQGSADYFIEMFGIDFHYRSISRGVIDSRDIIYFLSIIILSLSITVKNIMVRN